MTKAERDRYIELKLRIANIDTDVQIYTMYANYWTHFATSNTNYDRKVYSGYDRCLTKTQLEEEAFKTAEAHQIHVSNLLEEKYKLLKEYYTLELSK